MARRTLTIDSNGLHFTVDDGPEAPPPAFTASFSPMAVANDGPHGDEVPVDMAAPAPKLNGRARRDRRRGPMSEAQKDKIRATALRNARAAKRKGGGGKRRGR
jgi:hypothetical protein